MGAAAVAHLDRKLLAVGVVMAVDATHRPELQIVARSFASVTARAADRLMFAVQRKLGAAMLLNREQCRPKPVLVMAAPAIGGSEAAAMGIAVTVRALLKLQAPISPWRGELG